ncbi:MAG: hypothetical protein NUV80_01605 [Candidatus Berkelbacteria bacterium]|nr:hypothetical protein [Candidatus Berkelbacteria bacterium]MCR4307238.1 hypothetical protein [Candidatus Berkelbacteria bacterium]
MKSVRDFFVILAVASLGFVLIYQFGAFRPGDLNERWLSKRDSAVWITLGSFVAAGVLHFFIRLCEAAIEEGRRRERAKAIAIAAEEAEERRLRKLGLVPGGYRVSRR